MSYVLPNVHFTNDIQHSVESKWMTDWRILSLNHAELATVPTQTVSRCAILTVDIRRLVPKTPTTSNSFMYSDLMPALSVPSPSYHPTRAHCWSSIFMGLLGILCQSLFLLVRTTIARLHFLCTMCPTYWSFSWATFFISHLCVTPPPGLTAMFPPADCKHSTSALHFQAVNSIRSVLVSFYRPTFHHEEENQPD